MPMHDWARVRAGTYHHFRFQMVAAILALLNRGLLPAGYFAMAEQDIGQVEADLLTLAPEQERYARKANRIAVRHELGEVVAVIEFVSPGNKDRKHSLESFVRKAVDLIKQDVNLLIIDPFRPGPHDPLGMPAAIGAELTDERFDLQPDKPLSLAAYQVAPIRTVYVEPFAVGDPLADMPLFLDEDFYVDVSLEQTYKATWDVLPAELRQLVEAP